MPPVVCMARDIDQYDPVMYVIVCCWVGARMAGPPPPLMRIMQPGPPPRQLLVYSDNQQPPPVLRPNTAPVPLYGGEVHAPSMNVPTPRQLPR